MKLLAIISADVEIIDLARDCGFTVVGVFDPNSAAPCLGLPVLGSDDRWAEVRKDRPGIQAALALDPPRLREKAAAHYGFDHLVSLIAADAYVASSARIGPGCLLQRGVKIMSNAAVGAACKINVNATVHHDSSVGDYCTLAPGALLLGGVRVEERVFIGAAAVILPKIRIGRDATIGAGAVVVKDVLPGITVAGVPARELK